MSDFNQTWIEGFVNYAKDIARIYKNNPEQILNCLGFDSVVGSLNETYQAYVKDGQMRSIENLDLNEKNRLWEQARKYSDSKVKCVMICKAIYLLDVLTGKTINYKMVPVSNRITER